MRSRGFTLIELVVVVLILAILTALAAPSFAVLTRTQRIRAAAVDLFADLTMARSEAIKRGTRVSLIPLDAAATKDWARGWNIVLTDTPATVINSREAFAGGLSAPNGPDSVVFGAAGRLTAAATRIEIRHPDIDSSHWRCITVELSGRPVSKTGGCP
jgi:type IV fimbrial biogenesis protein FimT